MRYFVYILKCVDKTLYTGCTSDLKKRMREHNGLKKGAHYTKVRRPVVLAHVEKFKTLAEARSREAEIKNLRRKQKLALLTK